MCDDLHNLGYELLVIGDSIEPRLNEVLDDHSDLEENPSHPASEEANVAQPAADTITPRPSSRRATVEDADDEDDPKNRTRYCMRVPSLNLLFFAF